MIINDNSVAADLLRRRVEMLSAVRLQAQALSSMSSTDVVCLCHHDYLRVFRLQQQVQQGQGRLCCFPEQGMLFGFEEGGMVFGVNRPGLARSGIPLWTGESTALCFKEHNSGLHGCELPTHLKHTGGNQACHH